MDLLIKFRAEAAQLDEVEMKTLIHTFIDSCNKNEIISCIFAHFHSQYVSKKSINKLQHINDCIPSIISNRKKMEEPANGDHISMNDVDDISIHDEDEEQQELISIDSLPTELINECSSYLEYDDHTKFGQCNRSIYISINCPFKLYHLDMTKMMKMHRGYSKPNNIKVLKSMTNNLNQYLSNSWIKRLTLDFDTFITFIDPKVNWYEYGELDIKLIIKTIHIKGINFSNIKHLIIRINAVKRVPINNLCDFMQIFPNLQHLSMCGRYCLGINLNAIDMDTTINKMDNLLPDLTMISTDIDDFFNDQLIKMRGNQLVSLRYNASSNIDLADFSKLKELHIENADITELSASISKLPVLERLRMDRIESDCTDYDMKILMMTIGITKCKSLQYIGFYDNCRNCTLFVRFLKIAFIETMEIHRERIKISLKVLPSQFTEIKSTNFLIAKYKNGKFVDAMKQLLDEMNIISVNWMNFMIRISLYNKAMIRMIRKYENEYSIFEMADYVIMSNKNCAINGYGEY